jgi:hypothetical protein
MVWIMNSDSDRLVGILKFELTITIPISVVITMLVIFAHFLLKANGLFFSSV